MSSGIICWAVMPSRNIPADGGDNFYAAAWLGNKGRWWAYKRFLAQKNGPPGLGGAQPAWCRYASRMPVAPRVQRTELAGRTHLWMGP